MKKLLSVLLTMSFIGYTSVACASYDDASSSNSSAVSPTTGSAWDDQSIRNRLSSNLNDMYPGNNIEVTVYNKNVLLTGQVATSQLKDEVGQVAKNYPHVIRVLNYLQVGRVETVGQKSKDAWITTKVKSKLLTISGVNSGEIKVVTTNRVVYLFGNVTKNQEKAIVNNIKRINGVKEIITFFTYR